MISSPSGSPSKPQSDQSGQKELWQAAYRLLEQTIVPQQLFTWIQPLELLDTENAEIGLKMKLAAPNDFSAKWVRDNYRRDIETAFSQVTGAPCEIQLSVKEGLSDTIAAPYEIPYEPSSLRRESPQSNGEGPTGRFLSDSQSGSSGVVLQSQSRANTGDYRVDSRYSFESFVVGASNQFAHASAVAVAEHPARQYNPLFLYSPPGLGKTHLLHAIANHIIAKNPQARVAYLSAEKFVNEMIDSLQHRRMSDFRKKYRDTYDMILIDDIQFIAGKNASEEEFFHTFNALHSSKRQIVVTSDRAPKEIEGLEERIRTRFEWGLVADITIPEIETRIAILKTKAERDDIYLPDEVATFLATYVKSNVRELEGVLIRLQAQASLSGAEISLEMAKHELRNSIPEEGSNFTIESILTAVAKHYHLKPQDFKSTSRAQSVVLPRQIAMYLIRKYTGLVFKEIASSFGGKDHTTIMHACTKIEKGIETDRALREAVEAIQNNL